MHGMIALWSILRLQYRLPNFLLIAEAIGCLKAAPVWVAAFLMGGLEW